MSPFIRLRIRSTRRHVSEKKQSNASYFNNKMKEHNISDKQKSALTSLWCPGVVDWYIGSTSKERSTSTERSCLSFCESGDLVQKILDA